MRWTHHAETPDAGLDEQMWQILATEALRPRSARDLSVRSGVFLVAGAVPLIAAVVWMFAYAFGLGVR